MEFESLIEIRNIEEKYNGWIYLDIPKLSIPKGFAIALIGENGAGKSTFLKILSGVRNDYTGSISYFNGEKKEKVIRNNIGYTSPNDFFLSTCTIEDFGKTNELLYDNFSKDKYKAICEDLGLSDEKQAITSLSDGMKMKTAIASVLARDTKLLLLDEPASPFDPLMRDKLCAIIRDYLDKGNGEKSVLFSTHNIYDMENVTDYAIIIAHGRIIEQGFVEDLKEKYVIVKGEARNTTRIEGLILGFQQNDHGFEGLCAVTDLEKLDGFDITTEVPTLSQISVALMKDSKHPLLFK